MEEPLYFPSDDFRLFGVLHQPDAPAPESAGARITQRAAPLGLVFCAPFAEEQKQACRVFVETARALAARGIPSLRFDYRGTGDSQGPFTDFSLAGALRDIQAAAALLRERAGVARIALLGLRLGASLALQSAECGVRSAECEPPANATSDVTRHAARGTHATLLVLWQPIVEGALFYRLNIRRMLVRQMMTHGKATGQRDTGQADTIDLDGFLASRAMCEEIKALNLAKATEDSSVTRLASRVLVAQIAHSPEPSAELRPLLDRLGPATRFLPFVMEPFWDRLGYVDCSPLIQATVAWLADQSAA